MPAKDGRSTESEIAIAVIRYLASTRDGEATIANIKSNLNKSMNFTDADLVVSDTRPNERVWEQQVRNIVSHRLSSENFVHDGLLSYLPRRLAITDDGRNWLKKKGY